MSSNGNPGIRSMGDTLYTTAASGSRNFTAGETDGWFIKRHATPRLRKMPGRKLSGIRFMANPVRLASIIRQPACLSTA